MHTISYTVLLYTYAVVAIIMSYYSDIVYTVVASYIVHVTVHVVAIYRASVTVYSHINYVIAASYTASLCTT